MSDQPLPSLAASTAESSCQAPLGDGLRLQTSQLAERRAAAKAQRNLAIFKKVEIEKFTHEEVAQRFNLRRARVTQIVNEVRRQLAQASADDPQVESHLARQRLEKKLEKLRLEHALQAAAEAMRNQRPTLITYRAGSRQRNGQVEGWSECISRDKSPSVQAIKTFLRVSRELGELNEREIAENPVDQKLDQFGLIAAIANILAEWRGKAVRSSDPPSPEFVAMVQDFEFNLRQWMYRYQYGATAAQAWPWRPEDQTPAPSQGQGLETELVESESNEINQAASEINIGLTSDCHFCAAPSPAPTAG